MQREELSSPTQAAAREGYHAPTTRPHAVRDLLLAPIAAEIDLKLQHLRELPPDELSLAVDVLEHCWTREDRAACVLAAALEGVDLHGWSASITDDAARLRLTGGSVSLDLGLSASLLRYIEGTDPH